MLVTAGLAVLASAPTAQAADAPGAPAVTSSEYPSGITGAVVRTPGTFTFTPPEGSGTVASYVYSLNVTSSVVPPMDGPTRDGARVAAAPDNAPTAVVIRPVRVGPNVLYVYAVSATGAVSATTAYSFTTAALTTPDPSGDFTGDGVPDFIAAGGSRRPGLWLYPGTDSAGHVTRTRIQVAEDDARWTGATVSAADFTDDGIEDLLVKRADGTVEVLPGNGDGRPFDSTSRVSVRLDRIDGGPDAQPVDQIVVPPVGSLTGNPFPDLYALVGNDLYLYPAVFPPGAYGSPQLISTGWADRTIAAAVSGGNPALFSRDNRTGQLDLWVGDAAAQVPAGAADSTRHTYATRGFGAGAIPVLAGADINVDGLPDVWGVTRRGAVYAYLNTGAGTLAGPVRNRVAFWGGRRG